MSSYPIVIIRLMQSSQRLDHPLNPINIHPTHPRHNLLLHVRITVQEPLNQLPIHKPERLISFPNHAPESAELVKWEGTKGVDEGGDYDLKAHKEVLMFGVDHGEEVD